MIWDIFRDDDNNDWLDNDWVKDDWNINRADNWEDYRQGMTTNLASQTLSSEYVSSMIASAEYSTDKDTSKDINKW